MPLAAPSFELPTRNPQDREVCLAVLLESGGGGAPGIGQPTNSPAHIPARTSPQPASMEGPWAGARATCETWRRETVRLSLPRQGCTARPHKTSGDILIIRYPVP